MICVIDYGMGNLRSVSKALEKLGASVCVTSDPVKLGQAEKIVLPGVGAFGDASLELQRRKLFTPLQTVIRKGVPFLGICLGLQLLFDSSEESPGIRGLGIYKGVCRRFRAPALKIPHMGWNELKILENSGPLLASIPLGSYFYFVHSYYAVPKERSLIRAVTQYGSEEFASFIGDKTVWATQFHPEKSQDAGLQILDNFIAFPSEGTRK